MVWVADDLAAWLVELLADAGRRKLADLVAGDEFDRALRRAATAAVQATAGELSSGDEGRAGRIALIISEVFAAPVPGTHGAQVTVLEALTSGIAQQVAVLEDRELTGTGQSSAEVAGIRAGVLGPSLTGHLLAEIVSRGARGGPLFALAAQINADLGRLQVQQTHDMVDQLGAELLAAIAEIGRPPGRAAGPADRRSQAPRDLIAILSVYETEPPHSRLRYEAVRGSGGELRIWPRDPYLDLVRSAGPLEMQKYGVSMWTDGFIWPALDVKIVNNTVKTVFFHEARFNVLESRTDLRPLPVIHWLAGGPYLTLKNLGWGPMEDCRLWFHLERPEEPSPLTADRLLLLDGDGQMTDGEPLRDALTEAGVDVQALGIDEQNLWISPRVNGRPAPPEMVGPFTSGWAAVVGDLEYMQTKPDGSRARQRHNFRSLIIFSPIPGGAKAPTTATYQVRLQPDATNYEVTRQISHSLGPGETDRFLFSFAAERSSLHAFSVNLLYNDVERLDCGLVALELFISRDVVKAQAF